MTRKRRLKVRNQKVGKERTGSQCGSTRSIKFGQDAHVQQCYRCVVRNESGCSKAYKVSTGTEISGMNQPNQWDPFMVAMYKKGYRAIKETQVTGDFQVNTDQR
ncbi:MAG: hypothetical protein OXC80_06825 [Gammaproteobacteria bacterium]|nr:hypothetical protein [Gammaproteobacteria bacterium]